MELEMAVRYLKLLADGTRLKLLGLIADRERSVGEIAEILGVREPTVSHHLSRLAAAGLVASRAEGTARLYRVDLERLQGISRALFAPDRVAAIGVEAEADAWERKVLGSYLEGERLTKIPDVRKKRDVVLRWLVKRFEVGRRYGEREVNEIILAHHPDFATLRRELIGARLMSRDAGVYWRTPDSRTLATAPAAPS
jgi:hypothetical protein